MILNKNHSEKHGKSSDQENNQDREDRKQQDHSIMVHVNAMHGFLLSNRELDPSKFYQIIQ